MSAIPFLHYEPDNPEEPSSLTVILNGAPRTLTSQSSLYHDALGLLNEGAEEDELLPLFVPVEVISERLTRLSENITSDGSTLYYDNDPIDEGVARHIVRVMNREGRGNPDGYMPTVRFIEKLYQNPSLRSRHALYEFLRRFDFTITADGDFIGYKGVRADYTSINAGPGIVDGVHMRGHLPNNPGSTLEVPRSYVNADTSVGCSTGLHVGTYDYASRFARGGLLTVAVNPRDVVSVPDDCNYQKVRTCRYRVIETTEREYEGPVWDDDDWDEDWD